MEYYFPLELSKEATTDSKVQHSIQDGRNGNEGLILVSPKPVITTVTKQAEISPTEKFIGVRKISVNSTQPPFPISLINNRAIHEFLSSEKTTSEEVTHSSFQEYDECNLRCTYTNVRQEALISKGSALVSTQNPSKAEISTEELLCHSQEEALLTNNFNRPSTKYAGHAVNSIEGCRTLSSSDAQESSERKVGGFKSNEDVKLIPASDMQSRSRFVLKSSEMQSVKSSESFFTSKHLEHTDFCDATKVNITLNTHEHMRQFDEIHSSGTINKVSVAVIETQSSSTGIRINNFLPSSSDLRLSRQSLTLPLKTIQSLTSLEAQYDHFKNRTKLLDEQNICNLPHSSFNEPLKHKLPLRKDVFTNGSLNQLSRSPNYRDITAIFRDAPGVSSKCNNGNTTPTEPSTTDQHVTDDCRDTEDSSEICEISEQHHVSSSAISNYEAKNPPKLISLHQGVINPGFVFESQLHLDVEDDARRQPSSPSLLDTLHKRYWANGHASLMSGESCLQSSADNDLSRSAFRERHQSYCRVVEQNTAEELCLNASSAKKDFAPTIRMFGNVPDILNISCATSSPTSERNAEVEKKSFEGAAIPENDTNSVSKLNLPALGGAAKLTRKFSLSPKVFRRRIIAKLQDSDKAVSSESEADDISVGRVKRDGNYSKRQENEIEVLDACSWLIQAGFPQYVQLYEDGQFPVDTNSVEKDHSFLDHQLLQSLFRRLHILNKSVQMKLDIHNRKLYGNGMDDDDEACVLSHKWQFERTSGRWSHVDQSNQILDTRLRSCSSRDSLMTDDTTEGELHGEITSPVIPSNTPPTVSQPEQQIKANQLKTSEKRKMVGLFLRVGSLRRSNKSKREKTVGGIQISGPTLINTPGIEEKMQRLGCVEIAAAHSRNEDIENNNNTKINKIFIQDNHRCTCECRTANNHVTEYILPPDYVTGTFPRELLVRSSSRICLPSPNQTVSNSKSQNLTCACKGSFSSKSLRKTGNRLSFYDNVPTTDDTPSPQQPPTPTESTTSSKKQLDAVLQELLVNISNLDFDEPFVLNDSNNVKDDLKTSSSINLDSAIVSPTSDGELSSLTDTPSDLALTPMETPQLKRQCKPDMSLSGEYLAADDLSASKEELNDGNIDDTPETVWRERRDSGVGSSLTRAPSDKKKKARLRWHSFVASHRPSFNSLNQHISSLSAGHLMYLRRLALLKITSLMEQYSPSHKSGFSLELVSKLLKNKMPYSTKAQDSSDRKVFGCPLHLIQQRTGQPLPQCILNAMRYLRKAAPDTVGIFRKSGVKSRIQKLRSDIELNPDGMEQFDSMQAYDVADMFKQYLRELPECLVTNKLSDTFLEIYQYIPQELRLEALQACVLLLPDESREVLESLLYFLSDMASYHDKNQMTASNIAMCFAPSLFNIHNRSNSKSPKGDRKNTGIPDQKEFLEQKSATECLTTMIVDCKKLFRVPEDFLSKCPVSSMQSGEPAPLSLLGVDSNYESHVNSCVQGLLKESKEKSWCTVDIPLGTMNNEAIDVSYKKVSDGNPLRLWKCSTEVKGEAKLVLHKILNERQSWDDDFSKWRTIEKLDKQMDIFQYVCTSMAPQPAREYTVLRAWKTDLRKDSCAIVMHSIDYETSTLGGGIRGVVLASHYLIEPLGPSKSRVTHISRVDMRGRQAKWYNRTYGYIAANSLSKIRECFNVSETTGKNMQETNV